MYNMEWTVPNITEANMDMVRIRPRKQRLVRELE
jgi:hypothetical protein